MQADFTAHYSGAPRRPILELASLAVIERTENVVLLRPSGVGTTQLASDYAFTATQARIKTHAKQAPVESATHSNVAGSS